MDSESTTYHFTLDDQRPIVSIVEAVAFVKGCGPMDIEPLAHVIDPDAFDDIGAETKGLVVSFDIEDLEVEVTVSSDIYITGPTADTFIHDSIDDASNMLLMAEAYEDEACADLLSVEPYSQEHLLGILYAQGFSDRLSAWRQFMDEPPADTATINVGDFTRSSTPTPPSDQRAKQVPVTCLPDAADLSELEVSITDQLSQWEESTNQSIVCFDSLTDLLQTVDRDSALEFLQTVIERMESKEAVAHYHFNPEPFSEETIERVTQLFDVLVKVDESGDWAVKGM